MILRFADGAQSLLLLAVGLLVACDPGPAKKPASLSSTFAAPSRASQIVAPSTTDTLAVSDRAQAPRDTGIVTRDTLSAAYKQFANFLELAVATRVPHVGWVDSVYTSGTLLGIDEQDLDVRWLAASRIISVTTVGDSGRAIAVITTVAKQTPEAGEGHYAVRFGIQDDTARWLLVRNDETGNRWMVNGDGAIVSKPRDRFSVLPLGRDLHWVVGSREQAIAAADSIRRARGLEVVR